MGWEPFKITYTSDYFKELYELAVELIKRGHAYIDHQTPDEIKKSREKKMNSPWRDRPIEESLKLFDDMKQGRIEEGKATLRMKQNMQSDNFNMYDLIAYRIKFTPHPHAGDKWCIYPSYDYAHCIVDSIENIAFSHMTLICYYLGCPALGCRIYTRVDPFKVEVRLFNKLFISEIGAFTTFCPIYFTFFELCVISYCW